MKALNIALGGLAVLIVGLVIGRMTASHGPPDESSETTLPGTAGPRPPGPLPPAAPTAPGGRTPAGPAAGPGQAPPAEKRILSPAIAGNLKEIVKAAREAQLAKDFDNLNYCQSLLKNYVGSDPAKAQDIVKLIKSETDMALTDVYMGALLANPEAAHAPETVGAMTELAEKDGDAGRRQQALFYLGQLQQPDPSMVQRVMRIAQGERTPQVQAGAVDTLATFMHSSPASAPWIAQNLLQIGQAAADPMVRAKAVYAMQIAEAPPDAVRGVTAFLADANREVRLAAAQTLGQARPELRPVVLPALEQAWRQEQDPIVRRNLVMGVVQASPPDAAQILQRMLPAASGPNAADIQDFLQILQAGETNPERIMQAKMAAEAQRAGGR